MKDASLKAGEGTLTFAENRYLIDLCGPFDRNLTQIEAGLEVQIARRGNVLSIWGAAEARARAEDILCALYARLEDGGTVGPADIATALHMPDGAAYEQAALSKHRNSHP